MGTVLVCEIGSVNYGKSQGIVSGNGALASFEVRPGSHGNIGSGKIHLIRASGGAYSIVSRQRVRICLVNDATNIATSILFDGFVATDARWAEAGFDAWYCDVECSDLNILFDWIRVSADAFGVSSGGTTTYGDQLLRIYRYATLNSGSGTPTIDPVNFNSLFASGGMPAFTGLRGSLGELTKKLSDNLNSVAPAVFPRYYLRSELSGLAGIYSTDPVLVVYDGAASVLGTDPVVAHFDADPVVGRRTILAYKRTKDGATLQTRTVAEGLRGNPANAYQAVALSDSGHRAVYPNPFDYEDAWKGPPLRTDDNLTTGAIQAIADTALADLENPRETWNIDTLDQAAAVIKPGNVIQLTIPLEGIAGTRYRVVDNTFRYLQTSQGPYLMQSITAGNKLRQMDEDAWPGTGRVVERDVIAPEAPTNFQRVVIETGKDDFQSDAPGRRRIALTWTPSISDDACRQVLSVEYSQERRVIADIRNNSQAAITVEVYANQSGIFYLQALDGAGNPSAPATLAFTTSLPTPAEQLINPNFAVRDQDDTDRAEGWTYTIAGSPTVSIDNTSKVGGYHAAKITLANTPDSVTLLSYPVFCLDPTTTTISEKIAMAVRAVYYCTHARNQLSVSVRWYDATDANFSTTALPVGATPVATTKTLIEPAPLVPPATAIYCRLELKYMWGGLVTGGADMYFGGCRLEEANTGGNTKGGSIGTQNLSDSLSLLNPNFADAYYDNPEMPAGWEDGGSTDGAAMRRIDNADLYGNTALEIDLPGVIGASQEITAFDVQMQNVDLERTFVNIKIAQEADNTSGGLLIYYLWLDEAGGSVPGGPEVIYNGAPVVGPQVIKEKVQPNAHTVARRLVIYAEQTTTTPNTIRLVIMKEGLALTADDLEPQVVNAGTYDVVTVNDSGLVTAGFMYVTVDGDVVVADGDLVYTPV